MMLGVLYAGPQTTATGRIAVKTVPTAMQADPRSQHDDEPGFCVRSAKILDFEVILVAKVCCRHRPSSLRPEQCGVRATDDAIRISPTRRACK